MSELIGNPIQLQKAATALGAAAGLVIPLQNTSQWAKLVSFILTYVASATVGNRQVVVDVLDASANVIFKWHQATNITAGQTAFLQGAGGIANAAVVTPIVQTMPIPDDCFVPPGGSIRVSDFANIDVNDTVAAQIVVTY